VKLIITIVSLLLLTTSLARLGEKKQALLEYTAAEVKKHIGETARVTDKVCEVSPRHWGDTTLVSVTAIRGRPNASFYALIYSDVIPGPKLDLEKLKGVVVTVTGEIKIYGQTGIASIDVRSTSEIAPPPH
jgi:hypothetical protein